MARHTPRDERGAAAVELALLLPVLLLILFGIIEFGRGYNAQITVTHAAREGARALAIGGDDAAVTAAVVAAADTLDPGDLDITIGDCDPGDPAVVDVSYDLDYSIPLFGTGTWTLDGEGAMRCGG